MSGPEADREYDRLAEQVKLGGLTEAEEDAILDRMDDLWRLMSREGRAKYQLRDPQEAP